MNTLQRMQKEKCKNGIVDLSKNHSVTSIIKGFKASAYGTGFHRTQDHMPGNISCSIELILDRQLSSYFIPCHHCEQKYLMRGCSLTQHIMQRSDSRQPKGCTRKKLYILELAPRTCQPTLNTMHPLDLNNGSSFDFYQERETALPSVIFVNTLQNWVERIELTPIMHLVAIYTRI